MQLEQRFTEPKNFEWLYFERDSDFGLREIRLGHLKAKKPIATAIILPGLSEFGEKYFELIRTLYAQNISAYVIDWFGQGKSGRYLKNPHKRHSYGFDQDIADLDMAIKSIIQPKTKMPLIMIGHSMGGHIGLRYLTQKHDVFSYAAFSAPLVGLREAALIPAMIAKAILNSAHAIASKHYVPGQSDWRIEQRENYGDNIFSSDPVRDRIHNFWCENDPELQQGGVTWGWVRAAYYSCLRLQDHLHLIQTPITIAQAELDRIVDNKAIKKTAQETNANFVELENAQHEIFMERDNIRDVFLSLILDEIKQHT